MWHNFQGSDFVLHLKRLREREQKSPNVAKCLGFLRPFSSKEHETSPAPLRKLYRHYYDPVGKNLFTFGSKETTGGCEINSKLKREAFNI